MAGNSQKPKGACTLVLFLANCKEKAMRSFSTIILLLLFCHTFSSAQRTIGLFLNDSSSFDGYTLLAPTSSNSCYLIDNCGRQVHTWASSTRGSGSTYLLEDGRLLRTGFVPNSNFFGGGSSGRIELIDWSGALLWGYNYSNDTVYSHHDVEYLPNGNILVLAWEYRSEEAAIANGRDPEDISTPIWPEQIVELQPVGNDEANIVWEWHLWDHLIQDFDSTKANYGVVAEHPELVDINYSARSGDPDWIHANSVAYNAELDQIIINSRDFDEFWIIDHSTTTSEAAGHSGGRWGKGGDLLYRWGNPMTYQRGDIEDRRLFMQHDVHWIPDSLPDGGKIMVYNNGLNRPDGNFSSIDILTPPTDAQGNYRLITGQPYGPSQLDWTYQPAAPNTFFSPITSGAQRLPNGNTLICIGIDGELLEVDAQQQLVWRYINPVRQVPFPQGEAPFGNGLFRAYRYPPEYPAFNGRLLIPGDPIELDPLPLPEDCQPTSTEDAPEALALQLFPNPIVDQLYLQFNGKDGLPMQVISTAGQVVWSGELRAGDMEINSGHWPPGLYILTVDQQYFFKLIKT
ncbi:MAG: aryl-sulfate sulfotransferase [Bacteroidota bacterium]